MSRTSAAVRQARRARQPVGARLDHPAFELVRPALSRLGALEPVPPVDAIDAALGPLAGVRFVVQSGRERGYDAAIVRAGRVPTRPGDWHDLMNALIWATFPAAKRALHERQLALVEARGSGPHRTPEEDALAILDEAGVLQCADGVAVFGHGVLEALALGTPLVRQRGVVLAVSRSEPPRVDAQLADWLRRGGGRDGKVSLPHVTWPWPDPVAGAPRPEP